MLSKKIIHIENWAIKAIGIEIQVEEIFYISDKNKKTQLIKYWDYFCWIQETMIKWKLFLYFAIVKI